MSAKLHLWSKAPKSVCWLILLSGQTNHTCHFTHLVILDFHQHFSWNCKIYNDLFLLTLLLLKLGPAFHCAGVSLLIVILSGSPFLPAGCHLKN